MFQPLLSARRFAAVATGASFLSPLNYLFVLMASLLALIYAAVGSYAVTIIVVGVGVTLLSTPLTASMWRSQVTRARLAPELDELNRKFASDRRRLASETAGLFKSHGVSPWAGCLPALLSAPIFLSLYQVIRGLTYRPPSSRFFQPRYLAHASRLFHSLAASTTMQAWGVDLGKTGAAALQISPWSAGFFLALVAVTVLSGVWQQHLVKTALPTPSSPTTSSVQTLSTIVPWLFAVWGVVLPLAVTLYYASSSIVRVAQQWILIKAHPF